MKKISKANILMALAIVLAGVLVGFYAASRKAASVPQVALDNPGTGLGIVVSTSVSEGKAEADSTIVAVLLNEEGTILQCKVDVAQNQMPVNADGTLALEESYRTKQEKGSDYGMAAASGIGKEWNEQADAFAAYVVGKTAAQVAEMPLKEGAAADADLLAGCTIHVSDLVEATLKACRNAKELGAADTDTLSLGVVSSNAYGNTDATADAAGVLEVDTTVAVVTKNANGAVTGALVDAVQPTFSVAADGVITAPESVSSKLEKGADYGMAPASGIGKEWFEQSEGLCAYLTGKTADQIAGIPTDGSDADLAAVCTVSVGDMLAAAAKAAA